MAHTFLIDVRLLILETKLCNDLLFAHFMVRLALARIILYFSIFSVVGDAFTLCKAFFSVFGGYFAVVIKPYSMMFFRMWFALWNSSEGNIIKFT